MQETCNITINGKAYAFVTENNLVLPCPCCSVPACGREYFLYAAVGAPQPAIVFDGGLFDLMCHDFLGHNMSGVSYENLPLFFREWNEQKGWNALADETSVDAGEWLLGLETLRLGPLPGRLEQECRLYCTALAGFVKKHFSQPLFLLK